MKDIIIKEVKERCFLKRRKVSKIGVEGSPLHDILVSQSDNKLVCFCDDKDGKHYLYSLVNGELIDSSPQEIECLGDYYYEKYGKDYGVASELLICRVDFENNKYEVVNSNDTKQYYDYERNMLVQYNPELKMICMIDMDTNQKHEFTFNDLPDIEFESVYIYYEIDSQSNFMVSVTFSDSHYFNVFNINTNKFTFQKFFEGEVWEVREYNDKLYIITYNNELIDQTGNVLIASGYDNIQFENNLPYINIKQDGLYGVARVENGEILIPVEYYSYTFYESEGCVVVVKDGKYGLIDLENGKTIFETKYDEIIIIGNYFRAITKTYTTYIKDKK